MSNSNNAKQMTILQHLQEIRARLIWCVVVYIAATLICLGYSSRIYGFIIRPMAQRLVGLSVGEPFYVHFRIAVVGGLVLSLPFITLQLLVFVMPALERREKMLLILCLPLGFLLFSTGILFGYFQVRPLLFGFFMGFTSETLQPYISASSYISFLINSVLPFGFVFELPLMIMLLTHLRLMTPAFLVRNRKYAILVMFISAAILTPPDVASQVLMAIPLLALYEIGIITSKIMIWIDNRRATRAG